MSQWLSGSAHLPAAVLPHLCDFVGDPALVLGPYAREVAHHLVPDVSPDARPSSRVLATAEIADEATGLTVAVARAEADGTVDAAELEELEARVERLGQRVANLRSGLGPRAVRG